MKKEDESMNSDNSDSEGSVVRMLNNQSVPLVMA